MEIPSIALVVKLMDEACKGGFITTSQLMKGFYLALEHLEFLFRRNSFAKSSFQAIATSAISNGWLGKTFLKYTLKDKVVPIEDDEKVKETIRRYKGKVLGVVRQYFLSDDIPEVIQSLVDLGASELKPLFLMCRITSAIKKTNREKEMASVLLSSLHTETFCTVDIVNGFSLVLNSTQGTLDMSDDVNNVSLFLARAVVDEVLTLIDLDELASKLPPKSSRSETVHMARFLVFSAHAEEKFRSFLEDDSSSSDKEAGQILFLIANVSELM